MVVLNLIQSQKMSLIKSSLFSLSRVGRYAKYIKKILFIFLVENTDIKCMSKHIFVILPNSMFTSNVLISVTYYICIIIFHIQQDVNYFFLKCLYFKFVSFTFPNSVIFKIMVHDQCDISALISLFNLISHFVRCKLVYINTIFLNGRRDSRSKKLVM